MKEFFFWHWSWQNKRDDLSIKSFFGLKYCLFKRVVYMSMHAFAVWLWWEITLLNIILSWVCSTLIQMAFGPLGMDLTWAHNYFCTSNHTPLTWVMLPHIVSILDQHACIATMDHIREHFQNWDIQTFHVTAMNGFLMP